jgi:hypothetical protein
MAQNHLQGSVGLILLGGVGEAEIDLEAVGTGLVKKILKGIREKYFGKFTIPVVWYIYSAVYEGFIAWSQQIQPPEIIVITVAVPAPFGVGYFL